MNEMTLWVYDIRIDPRKGYEGVRQVVDREDLIETLREMNTDTTFTVEVNNKAICDIYCLQFLIDNPVYVVIGDDRFEYDDMPERIADSILKLVQEKQRQ